jgi:hypothetical protein
MHFPKHWHLATARGTNGMGQPLRVDAWGWSDESEATAAAHAARRAQEALERRRGAALVKSDWYYDRRPLREEILHEVRDDDGTLVGVVTRSRSGPMVLNTARIMFIDIDFPTSAPAARPSLWRQLFGRRSAPRGSFALGCVAEERAVTAVRAWVAMQADFGLRMYRTAAGLRLLVTHAEIEPRDAAPLLAALGADPRYAQLCAGQESYRARLTAKPWRIGLPRFDASCQLDRRGQKRRDIWYARYEAASAQVAVCRFLGAVGKEDVLPSAGRIVAQHDRATRALEAQLMLA